MTDETPRSPREEAERLVASLLGAASTAIQGAQARQQIRELRDLADRFLSNTFPRGEQAAPPPPPPPAPDPAPARPAIATGSPECCVCPLCRVIAALRDPNPEFAERLATAAGDVATGLTGVLRAFGTATSGESRPAGTADPWRAATNADSTATRPPEQHTPMAKKAVRKVVTEPAEAAPDDQDESGESETP
jgi:hypothetical protein